MNIEEMPEGKELDELVAKREWYSKHPVDQLRDLLIADGVPLDRLDEESFRRTKGEGKGMI